MHAGTDAALAARQSVRGRTRREDVRLAAAQVSRLAAEGLPPGALLTSAALRAHFLVFMDDTRALLAAGAHGACLPAPPLWLGTKCLCACNLYKSAWAA